MEVDSTGRGGKKEAGAGTGLAVGCGLGNDWFAGTGGWGRSRLAERHISGRALPAWNGLRRREASASRL
jgi:hypothetical protein